MADFHEYFPYPVYQGKNMDVIRESTYPREIVDMMGAPMSYAAYLTAGGRKLALGAADTETGLLPLLKRWKENENVYRLIKDDIQAYEPYVLLRARNSVVTVSPAPKRTPAARTTTKQPKKTAAAKTRKTTKKPAKPKTKKTTTTTPKLTPSQRKYLAINGFVMVKRGGKYVRVTG